MPAYGYALGEDSVHVFASLPARQRKKLLHVFESLTAHPHKGGDYQESGASGLNYEVKLTDNIILTW
jgi:hypothetical protein